MLREFDSNYEEGFKVIQVWPLTNVRDVWAYHLLISKVIIHFVLFTNTQVYRSPWPH